MRVMLAPSKSYMEPENAIEICQMWSVPYIQIARLFHCQSKIVFKIIRPPELIHTL